MTNAALSPAEELLRPLRHVSEPERIHGRLMDVVNSRFDLVGPQSNLTINEDCSEFLLRLNEPVMLHTGVADGVLNAQYTRGAFRHVCERLRIPVGYADRLVGHQNTRVTELASDSINVLSDVDDRRALFRYLQTDSGLVLRAVRSDKYLMLDNDAYLMAIVKGLQAHSLDLWDCKLDADITVDRARIRLHVPEIGVNARELMRDYRSPWDRRPGNELPMLFAGLEFTNSETGAGRFNVTPRAVFQVCSNGVTRSVEFSRTHLGASLDDGAVQWSDQTKAKALDLITSQVEDAVGTFLSTDYLEALVQDMMAAKSTEVQSVPGAVQVATNRFTLSDAEATLVLNCFTKGGDTSVFGLGQAMTAAAQKVEDGDRQAELEATFDPIISSPQAFVGQEVE